MKKILIMIAMVCLIFIVGCSPFPLDETVEFCESKGLEHWSSGDAKIQCYISNEDYKAYKLSIQINSLVDDKIQQHEKSEDATNGEK